MKKIDLTGQRFGRLTVIEEVDQRKYNKIFWKCVCDCGRITIVHGSNLKSGHTESCGCLRIIHGMINTKTYRTWQGMIGRCNNPNNINFKNYGGRGIKVCQQWLKFANFFEDMGLKPAGLTIERTDNNKGYYKENCRWATQTEQNRNQRVCKTNKTGATGVLWLKQTKKYVVKIMANYKQIHIGCFAKLEDAVAARKEAELRYWG